MINAMLLGALALGIAAALRVEHARLAGLRRRVTAELDGLAAWVDRRRALLGQLAEDLPRVLPACHAGIEVLGRSQRATVEALARLRTTPADRAAAELFAQAQESFERALTDLHQDAPGQATLEALRAQVATITARRRAVTDAVQHYRDRRGKGLRRYLGHGEPAWVA